MQTFAKRLRAARTAAHLSQSELARRVGVRPQSIQALEAGTARGTQHILEIAREVNVRPDWLRSGMGPMTVGTPESGSVRSASGGTVTIAGDEFGLVPVFDARAAAGAGGEGTDEATHYITFRMQWIRSVTQSSLDQLGVIEVDSDSMEPTLRSGDHALVDLLQRMPSRKDGLYVLRRDHGLQVKRLTVHPVTGKLSIRSDNPAYESFSNIDPADVDIVGRVIWIGRRV